jgi:hypothetical protein
MNALTIPKRDEKRSRVFLAAQVEIGGQSVAARIRDISATGALLESDFTPALGDVITISCGENELEARVAWIDRSWFGVEFDSALEMTDMVDQSGARLAVAAPRNYRAGALHD